ncbi:MAG: ATP-binding protein, partial [Methanosarcinales archaeon]
PTQIMFIYGPINSGKTALIDHIIKKLPEKYRVFYINLRGRFIRDYDDFLKVLFDIEYKERLEKIKEVLKPIAKIMPESYAGIPIPKDLFLKLFEKKEVEDAFVYIETVFRTLQENGFIPILLIDELQVIGDIKIDELLVYKLFNFLVRLTKELHISHVFAITSDSLFIERVYSEAMLQGRCEYLLVDDFEKETTFKLLEKYNFNEEKKSIAWHYCGGKPVCLISIIKAKPELERKASELLKDRLGFIKSNLKMLKELGGSVDIKGNICKVEYEKVINALKKFKEKDIVGFDEVDEETKFYLVKNNVLFVDPRNDLIKPQSKLDLIAIREIIGMNV